MREKYYDSYDLKVRDNFATIQKFTGFAMLLMAIMSLGYFVFWLGAISDEIFFEYGRPYFEPLAKLLNLGAEDSGIYLNTCLYLLVAMLPTFFIQVLFNKLQEALLQSNALKQEKKRQKEQKEEYENYMSRFDYIKTYSICLSIDYEGKKQVGAQNKQSLNKAIYTNLATSLYKLEPTAKITQNDVFIFTSSIFAKYDLIYDTILNSLSHFKNVLEKKYSFKLIPSITTDAFSSNLETNIRKQHYEIQSFNFKNRALTTATFANKYKHLKHEKYAGIPIGEYAYFGNEKMGTYELNIINKNLDKTLSQM